LVLSGGSSAEINPVGCLIDVPHDETSPNFPVGFFILLGGWILFTHKSL